jgi:hypothetical protein
MEVLLMLMRTDPFRELDRLSQQMFGGQGTLARPSAMPMDAWRDGDSFHVEFDLPGVDPDSIDLDVERNVVTVKAERPVRASDAEMIAAERPRGVFSRCGFRSLNEPSRARSPSAPARNSTSSTPDRRRGWLRAHTVPRPHRRLRISSSHWYVPTNSC